MVKFSALAVITALATPAYAKVFLKEQFNDKEWDSRWTVPSKWKKESELGKWAHTSGEWFGAADDKGIQTSEDSRFYGLSAPLETPFKSTGDKPLVIQYSVKHEQQPKLDCGGAYLKLMPGGKKFDADKFSDDTPYAVMFGPDVCGSSNKKTHVILHYDKRDENLLVKKEVPTETDALSHLYTLVVRPDNTYEVFVDKKSVRDGKLVEDFDFLLPEEIKDPKAEEPKDWVNEEEIADPSSKKPDGWDDIPEEIPDSDAKKPDDWDDEDDGEWEASTVPNPEYKGEWEATMIPNPDYKGEWVHPMIKNPKYVKDDKLYNVCEKGCTHIGIEIWQVASGSLFDDIIITDDLDEAFKFADDVFFKRIDGEEAMFDAFKESKKKKDDEEPEEPHDLDEDDDGFGDEF